jgi:HlyD family secretion protein
VGKLDIVAVTQGKLVPQSYVKVVQPADSGIIRKILVKEGDQVTAGQVLIQMDASVVQADTRTLVNEIRLRELQLRRIDAELRATPMVRQSSDAQLLFDQIDAQYRARRLAQQDALEGERTLLVKAQQDLHAAVEVESKLKKTVPIYREQAEAWDKLAKEGFAGKLMAMDRQRLHMENEQDLRAQAHTVESLKASIAQSEKRIAQIGSNYAQQLQNERVEAEAQLHKLRQDWDKQQHRTSLLELTAPQAGTVKDLATHTVGTVVAPGTILLTLVPQNEPLLAEVWVSNHDIGFVQPGQAVKVKLAAYPFQKYGMIDGVVQQVSADATDVSEAGAKPATAGSRAEPLLYRALVALGSGELTSIDGQQRSLTAGMQATAEINLGSRSVLEYLLSPLQRIAHEAGRER